MPKFRKEELAEGVTLYLGDCRDVISTLGKVDVVITDPPYGIGYVHSGKHGSGPVTQASKLRGVPQVVSDDKPFDPNPWINLCPNVLIWGADHFYSRLPDCGRWLAWNKLGDMKSWDSFADVEFAWHSKRAASRIFTFKWKGLACDKVGENGGLREHTTQKPIALMEWCIEQTDIDKDQIVLDPFMGSGTTGVAAVNLQRKFIGVEIVPEYYSIACRRISKALRTPSFLIQKPKFKQQQFLGD